MGTCSHLFFSTNVEQESLHTNVIPTTEQEEYLQASWQKLSEFLKASVSRHFNIRSETWIQGSYKMGTLIKPVRKGLEFDVDLGLYILPNSGQASPTALSYRSYVKELLQGYTTSDDEAKKVEHPSKENCERLYYKEDFHIDVPCYKLEAGTHYLAKKAGAWEESDPRGLYLWFKELAQRSKDGQQLRRLIRYIKNWSCQKFVDMNKDHQPSSIFLTVLTARAYQMLGNTVSASDDEALVSVLLKIREILESSIAVPNPVDHSENLNRMSNAGSLNFIRELNSFIQTGTAALGITNVLLSSLKWAEQFNHFFPIPNESYSSGQGIARILPEVRVSLLDTEHGSATSSSMNGIAGVPRGKWINFNITNPEHLPSGARIDWVVRNGGNEANNENDLGHYYSGTGLYRHTEKAAYKGRHFMDCIVYDSSNRLYAFRRIPVTITSAMPNRANTNPTPYWRRFAKRR